LSFPELGILLVDFGFGARQLYPLAAYLAQEIIDFGFSFFGQEMDNVKTSSGIV